jgi:hypothetical protein
MALPLVDRYDYIHAASHLLFGVKQGHSLFWSRVTWSGSARPAARAAIQSLF